MAKNDIRNQFSTKCGNFSSPLDIVVLKNVIINIYKIWSNNKLGNILLSNLIKEKLLLNPFVFPAAVQSQLLLHLNANKNFQTDDILVYNCFHLLITTICFRSLMSNRGSQSSVDCDPLFKHQAFLAHLAPTNMKD
ncbi:hypothetical protein T01_12464 [Trichinella spiralis]|uniref:Uncharacterized protein n=1 Tax=Trichinella spiralis TaxID=6334 RepID=A0A0V1BX33_TRISP|nr:hypothetical protein T01_12464 [Trichinella spiralis]